MAVVSKKHYEINLKVAAAVLGSDCQRHGSMKLVSCFLVRYVRSGWRLLLFRDSWQSSDSRRQFLVLVRNVMEWVWSVCSDGGWSLNLSWESAVCSAYNDSLLTTVITWGGTDARLTCHSYTWWPRFIIVLLITAWRRQAVCVCVRGRVGSVPGWSS